MNLIWGWVGRRKFYLTKGCASETFLQANSLFLNIVGNPTQASAAVRRARISGYGLVCGTTDPAWCVIQRTEL